MQSWRFANRTIFRVRCETNKSGKYVVEEKEEEEQEEYKDKKENCHYNRN
jgi:hypothetical protein